MSPAKYVVFAVLWMISIWRLPSAVRVPQQRALWLGFAALAVVDTIGIPAVSHGIDHALGVTNLYVLLKLLLGVVCCLAVTQWVTNMVRPDLVRRVLRPHLALAAAAATALCVLFAHLRMHQEVDDFYLAYGGSVTAAAFSGVFETYLGVVMAIAGWLFWSNSRHAGAATLRVGLRVLAAGTAVGFLYAALRIVQMTTAIVAPHATPPHKLVNDTFWVAVALIVTGNTIPACGVAARSLRDRRHLRELRPLWATLTTQVPEIVLHSPKGQSPRLRLHRLAIEIRDASLALTLYAPDQVHGRAIEAARARGLSGDELDAMVEAMTLHAAYRAKSAGRAHSPVASETEDAATPEGIDFDAEIQRLHLLNHAYHSPAATAFVQEYA
ncbi:MAB_1171c family putative transporter [Kitasatospora sp. LaBMicrA B282]|uniref:MAB_1171c family putative transporter n=1 Tax=Kitasatospora sp. LaBMicrA B282 TaxID=3420949 RepID=UPI003D10600E